MPTILGGNQLDTGYEISNSARMTAASTGYLSRTFNHAGNRKVFTWSGWVKRGVLGVERGIYAAGLNSGQPNANCAVYFYTDDKLRIWTNVGNQAITTSATFRDPAAWYHIVWTSQATSPYFKLYVNGTETEYENDTRSTYPGGNDTEMNQNNVVHYVGGWKNGPYQSMSGYLAEVHFLDGQTYDPTYFGETNDDGVWVPKEYTGGNYGDNGFYLQFKQTGTSANSSGIGADTSGNDNHWTPNNMTAEDVTTDTPTNNFCTMNPLMSFAGASDGIDAFSEGNTVVDSNNDTSAAGSTFGVKNGKWYYEAKLTTGNQSSTNFSTGWCQVDYEGQKGTGNGVSFMSGEDNAGMDVGGNIRWNNSGSGNQATFGNRSTNDIFQVALDLDNHKMWFGVNGTWSNGSASQSTTFNASSPDFSGIFDSAGVDYMPAFAQGSSGQTVLAYNFGNPSYANSSSESDDNGYGDFEYPVPSGFYSLCTKNLAEFG